LYWEVALAGRSVALELLTDRWLHFGLARRQRVQNSTFAGPRRARSGSMVAFIIPAMLLYAIYWYARSHHLIWASSFEEGGVLPVHIPSAAEIREDIEGAAGPLPGGGGGAASSTAVADEIQAARKPGAQTPRGATSPPSLGFDYSVAAPPSKDSISVSAIRANHPSSKHRALRTSDPPFALHTHTHTHTQLDIHLNSIPQLAGHRRVGGITRCQISVTNSGAQPGQAVLQLFLQFPEAAVLAGRAAPGLQFKGTRSIPLEPGEQATSVFTLTARDRSAWDGAAGRWREVVGEFGWQAGPAQDSPNVRGTFASD
jgi:hypothetical protein